MKNYSELKVALASDHAGFELKQKVQLFLEDNGVRVKDFGCHSAESCDYPDYAHPMAESVEQGECDFGIAICGSGQGMAITTNKHQAIRAALAWESPIAKLAREHNDANVLCLPARFISVPKALEIVNTFLSTDFDGGRHAGRVAKIAVAKKK